MSCHHAKGDPACSSSPEGQARARAADREYEAKTHRTKVAELERRIATMTADPSNYEVEDSLQVGEHLILKVRYPSCSSCAFEGNKVMVFLNTRMSTALKWRRIDPHFRVIIGAAAVSAHEAPSPSARFPATKKGWEDAAEYARNNCLGTRPA